MHTLLCVHNSKQSARHRLDAGLALLERLAAGQGAEQVAEALDAQFFRQRCSEADAAQQPHPSPGPDPAAAGGPDADRRPATDEQARMEASAAAHEPGEPHAGAVARAPAEACTAPAGVTGSRGMTEVPTEDASRSSSQRPLAFERGPDGGPPAEPGSSSGGAAEPRGRDAAARAGGRAAGAGCGVGFRSRPGSAVALWTEPPGTVPAADPAGFMPAQGPGAARPGRPASAHAGATLVPLYAARLVPVTPPPLLRMDAARPPLVSLSTAMAAMRTRSAGSITAVSFVHWYLPIH